MSNSDKYTEELRRFKSLLIVTALQKRKDFQARKAIQSFSNKLTWKPLSNLLIDSQTWDYVVISQKYDPKFVFCHPDILVATPKTSLYYRGLCGLSLKAVKDYFGSVDSLETGNCSRLDGVEALKMARTYNSFLCSIIKNSTDWTLENGNRTIIATLGITLDGVMRNKVGEIAEDRIRTLMLEWLLQHKLIAAPKITKDQIHETLIRSFTLRKDAVMRFGSEPDISFHRRDELLAVVEIKGGIDPAGALERYGAATKSFQEAVKTSPHCKNFYLGAVYTSELSRRMETDRLVEKSFNIIEILAEPSSRERFFSEIFHHTLRLI